MLWLVRKAFFGHVPFPVMHVDTEKKFPEMYAFRDRYAKEWGLNFIRELCPPMEADRPDPAARRALRRAQDAGPEGAIAKHGFNGLILGIRRDEEAIRAKERYFSPRGESGVWNLKDQPPEFWGQYMTSFPEGTHVRVHPLLHWTEVDIWRYTKRESIPVIDLYFAKNGKRYRSPGRSGHHRPDRQRRAPRSTRSSPSSRPPRCPSARAGRWTTNPRMPSSGCAAAGYM